MSLPKPVLLRRLSNELRKCSEYLGTDFDFDPSSVEDFPVEIDMRIGNVVAYSAPDQVITEHGLSIIITEEYGERKPEVRWKTPIFHPNIMAPEGGGYVCIKLLNDWTFGTTLLSFIKGVESLLNDPNPRSPFGTESCMAAAEYFKGKSTEFQAKVSYGKK